MIDLGRHSVCRRRCSQNVDDQTLVVTSDGEVHFPSNVWAPMPVKNILTTVSIVVPFDCLPKFVNLSCKCLFFVITVLKILTDGNECLCQKCCFYQVATIIFRTERFHFPRWTIQPMWPNTMHAISFFYIVGDLIKLSVTFRARNKTPFDTHQNRHDTKAASTNGNDILAVLRIPSIHVDPFECKSL